MNANAPLTSADLESLEEFRGLEENRDSRWRVHLRWMFENQPELTRSLHQANRLGLWVDRKYQQALEHLERLESHGLPRDQAWDVVTAETLAPPPPPNRDLPNPLPEEEQHRIERSLSR